MVCFKHEAHIFSYSQRLSLSLLSGYRPQCRGTLGTFTILRGSKMLIRFSICHWNTFSKHHQTLKQISKDSPLGAENFIFLLPGAATLKRLGNAELDCQRRQGLLFHHKAPAMDLHSHSLKVWALWIHAAVQSSAGHNIIVLLYEVQSAKNNCKLELDSLWAFRRGWTAYGWWGSNFLPRHCFILASKHT